ncbi:MAG TPA: hypothetical protein VF253_12090 [Candidatus Limnocylindrales bacterium]
MLVAQARDTSLQILLAFGIRGRIKLALELTPFPEDRLDCSIHPAST